MKVYADETIEIDLKKKFEKYDDDLPFEMNCPSYGQNTTTDENNQYGNEFED